MDDAAAPPAAKGKGQVDAKFGQGFLTDIWYFAALASDLKPGKLARHELLGEPVLLGRSRKGEVFALRDIQIRRESVEVHLDPGRNRHSHARPPAANHVDPPGSCPRREKGW